MSLCSSSWVSRGALPSAAVSVPSSGIKEVLQANGRRSARDGRMRLHDRSKIATSAPYTGASTLKISYHGGDHAAISSKGPMEKTIQSQKTARPCQLIRGQRRAFLPLSGRLQVLGGRLSGLAVVNDFEGDLLAFLELVEPGALDRADVDEDVLAAILRLDKSVALLRVKPLHGAFAHF